MISNDELLYFDRVKPYMDADGWFPDDILGDSYWVLTFCNRMLIDDVLYWKFVKHSSILEVLKAQEAEQ